MSDILIAAEADGWAGLVHCRKCGTGILVDPQEDGPNPTVECGRCAGTSMAILVTPRYTPPAIPTHVVYRMWDHDGQLLYVGVSSRIDRRISQHRRHKPWQEVATITLEHFPTRQEADQAELDAIHTENPLWNIKGAK